MNNKIRLIFIIATFIIFVAAVLIFNGFKSPLNPATEKISPLKITKISGNGKIYMDKNPIPLEGTDFSALSSIDIKELQYAAPLYFKADNHTAFEFYYQGTAFTVFPRSYLYFQSDSGDSCFYSGEFHWNKEVKDSGIQVYVREARNRLTLSEEGRIKIQDGLIEIWNYSNPASTSLFKSLKFFDNELQQEFNLNPNQLLVLQKDTPPKIVDLLPIPGSIDPANKIITLDKPEDSVVRFNWKGVPGVTEYKFRLYSSGLKENVLAEKTTQLNWINMDLLEFEEREFYWQVSFVDTSTKEQYEGVPSKLGYIRMTGVLLGKKDVKKPPQLNINDFTVNGNLVIIKGTADPNAQLFINDEMVKIDMEGVFIHDITYKTIGPKKITFRLISPLGIEAIEERNFTIYSE